MNWFKRYFPIYINTLNIFRPLKTWSYNMYHHWYTKSHKFPYIEIKINKRPFDWLCENFYTWYWWDHPTIWNFKKKWIIILIDDVQYKWKFGIREMESIPFILIRIFGYNLIVKFKDPENKNNYKYWESLDNIKS